MSIDAFTGAAPKLPSGFSHSSGKIPVSASPVARGITSVVSSARGLIDGVGVSPLVSSAKEAFGLDTSSREYQGWLATQGRGSGGVVANPAASSSLDPYPFADISRLYNTDAKTAYQEALANTAIQRQMDDFKRAGLNPVLATRYGGADGVGLVGNVAGVGAGYANTSGSTAGGGSGYSSPGSTSGRGGSASGLSSILNYASKNYNIQSAVASLASAATFGITKSFQGSAAVYYGVKGAFGVLNSLRK